MSPINLASKIDALIAQGSAFLVETAKYAIVSRLNAGDATRLGQLAIDLGWNIRFEDNTQTECNLADLGEDLAPYRLTLDKPEAPSGVIRLLTQEGFRNWLSGAMVERRVEVCAAAFRFKTYYFVVSEWGGSSELLTHSEIKSPRKIVRESGGVRVVPEDIRPWIMGESVSPDWTDVIFKIWANASALALARALCSEVTDDGRILVFSGPPKLPTESGEFAFERHEGQAGFVALQEAARWVFENNREIETRHRLFAMEVARSASGNTTLPAILMQHTGHILEGARLAFQMGLEDLSKDTIKALTDLRKSLGDETSKLADGMRQIATAVAGAMFAGLGLVAARVSGSASRSIVLILSIIIFCYVLAIIASNIRYVYIQRDIRREWRGRIYRFLSEEDYDKMVVVPSDRAEAALFFAMTVGGLLALALVAGIIMTS